MKTPEELRADWIRYMDGLIWAKGSLDEASWFTFLRAASCGVARETAMDAVCARIRGASGAVRPGKLESQCRRAYVSAATSAERGTTWTARPGYAKPAKPSFDDTKLKAFAGDWAAHVNAVWLGDRSKLDPATVSAAQFLHELYKPGESIVVFTEFKSQGQFVYEVEAYDKPRAVPIPTSGPEGVWFLVQPVDGIEHANPRTGKMSRRSEESVMSWRYLVLESDQAKARDWLGALVQLPLRICAIYSSGGKSIHALIRVDAVSKAHWDRECDAMEIALVTLGADPGALTAVRLSRLPGCLRAGREQKLLYICPNASGLLPICAQPPKRNVVEEYLRFADSLVGDDVDPEFKQRVVAGLKHYAPVCPAMEERLKSL